MARKIIKCLKYFIIFALVTLCISERACAYSITSGDIPTSVIIYFKDITSNLLPNDDYVLFKSSDSDYSLVVGDLEYTDNSFYLVSDNGKEYILSESDFSYSVNNINSFILTYDNNLIYSNLGDFPQLIERGTHYETLILICLFIIIILDILKYIFKH